MLLSRNKGECQTKEMCNKIGEEFFPVGFCSFLCSPPAPPAESTPHLDLPSTLPSNPVPRRFHDTVRTPGANPPPFVHRWCDIVDSCSCWKVFMGGCQQALEKMPGDANCLVTCRWDSNARRYRRSTSASEFNGSSSACGAHRWA